MAEVYKQYRMPEKKFLEASGKIHIVSMAVIYANDGNSSLYLMSMFEVDNKEVLISELVSIGFSPCIVVFVGSANSGMSRR